MSQACDVTVVVPCFNAEAFLAPALESALTQTLCPAEIIVIDDASTDGSAEIAKHFDRRVRLVERAENSGYCVIPKDIGIHEARTEFVAFLDADDLWLPTKLAQQMPLFNDPAVGLVYGRARTFVTGGTDQGAPWPDEMPVGRVVSDFYFRCYAPNSTVVARRAALLEVGGFDRSLVFCEDYDLWLRMAFRWKVDAVSDVVMRYRRHPNQASQRRMVQARSLLALENQHAEAFKKATGLSEEERRQGILQRTIGALHSEFYNERNLPLARQLAELIQEEFPYLDDETRRAVRRIRRRTSWPRLVFKIRDLLP